MATGGSRDLSNREGLGQRRGARRRGQASGRRKENVEISSEASTMPSRGGDGDVIDLTSSGDEGTGQNTGRGRVPKQRGDHLGAFNSMQQSLLPHTPRRRRPVRGENPADLTPNFRSAAAMAGWDDETLLLLAVGQESPALRSNQAAGGGTPEGPSRSPCPDSCGACLLCRDRKRATRTPGQAATPLSAARRHRRARQISSNEPIVPIPMAVFNDESDKCGAPAKKTEDSRQLPSEDKENKNPQHSAKTTSLKAKADAEESSKNGSLQIDQLREELTCVVCLDICFEPSTTTCGHSFCRGCLQSVYQKCGMRCPKCRQEMRATSKSDCPINTVLWNTIQLLFPQETVARLSAKKKSSEKTNVPVRGPVRTEQAEAQTRPGVARRISRPTPWRELTSSSGVERLRPNVGSLTFSRGSERLRLNAGNLTSFRRASEVLDIRQSTLSYPTYQQLRGRRPSSSYGSRQEEEDAALAAILQESFISEAGL